MTTTRTPDLADIVVELIRDAHPEAVVYKKSPIHPAPPDLTIWIISVNDYYIGVAVGDVFSSSLPGKPGNATYAELAKPTDPDFVDVVLHYARVKGHLNIPG